MAASLGPCKQFGLSGSAARGARCPQPAPRGGASLVPSAYKRNNQRSTPSMLPPLDPSEMPLPPLPPQQQRAAPAANPGQQQQQQQQQQYAPPPPQQPQQQQPQQQPWQQQPPAGGNDITQPGFMNNPYGPSTPAGTNPYPTFSPGANPGYINPPGQQQRGNNNNGGNGGYNNNNNRNNNRQGQGGYQTQGSPNAFATDPALWSSPPSQQGSWANPGRQGGYANGNRQGQGQQGGYNVNGGYGGNRAFPGFDDTADLLLQDLDASGYPGYFSDRWEEEVEVEEDTSPKFVNNKRVLVNREITASTVRVQDAQKQELGVMSFDEARAAALEVGADVVLINEGGDPPVVRLVEFSKYKFELERAAKAKQKSSKGTETKEVRLRPVTEAHDYEVKVKAAKGFLAKGSKVKLTMQFSGREMRFKDQGKEMMLKLVEDLSSVAKMDAPLSLRTSTFSATLSPLNKA